MSDVSSDAVNHPAHYGQHPSGVSCIEVTRHMGFDLGNAVKYIWRADLKGDAIEDLNKAAWYLHDEIVKRGGTPEFIPRENIPTGVKLPEQRTADCPHRERTGEHDWLSLAPGITGCRVCGKRKP